MLPEGEANTSSGQINHHEQVHDHSGKTSYDHSHAHLHPGVTSTPQPLQGNHNHYLWGLTTFDMPHTHAYNAQTAARR